jgi:hypothetical protein
MAYHNLPASPRRHRLTEEIMARQEDEGKPSEATDPARHTMKDNRRASTNDAPEEKSKPSRLAAVVSKLGLDAGTLITMLK